MLTEPLFLLLLIGIPLLSQLVSSRMKSQFIHYSKQPMPVSGREAAEEMLRQHSIRDVRVVATRGQLSDHYDPKSRTVRLSEVVYNQRNVAAVAVATHEVGHAVQHATGYPFLQMRSKMVPFLQLSNMVIPILFLSGAGISGVSGSPGVGLLFLAGLGLPALFSMVTLPVEFDASRRALRWLKESRLTQAEQQVSARKALFWAAMTYVVAALGSILQALAFARILLRRR
jgi:uncharacterized protein